MKKFALAGKIIIILVAILISTDYIGNVMATVEKSVNISKAEDCDIAFVGSSHVYRGINPQLIYDEIGVTSVNVSTSSQDIMGSYWLLRKDLRSHCPQVVFVEVPTWEADARETYALWNFHEYDYLKYLAYFDLKNDEFDINDANRFLAFRTEYNSITKSDFDYVAGEGQLKSDRWYNAVYSSTKKISKEEVANRYEVEGFYDSTKTYEYVDKIISLANEKNIKLVFFNAPWLVTKFVDEFYNELALYIEAKGIDFLNYSDLHNEDSVFDLSTDFSDENHLSYIGGIKFSKILCEYITGELGISHDASKIIDNSWEKNKYHYQYTYDLLNYDSESGSLIGFLEYANTLPDDYVLMLSFDAEAYYQLSEGEKSILRGYGIDPDFIGYAYFIVIKHGDEVLFDQNGYSSNLYWNVDGVSVHLGRTDNGASCRIGEKGYSAGNGTIMTAVYCISYDDVVYYNAW